MILIDLNQICMAEIMQEINARKNEHLEEEYLRHLILNTIRIINIKFREEYGRLVLVNDSNNGYWRKLVFPFYKGNKKRKRQNSIYDFRIIFDSLGRIKNEIRENFPYTYMEVDKCEADDIIAVLVKTYSRTEKILIVSRDEDFLQLQKYDNVYQYATVNKKFMKEETPQKFLIKKILIGDRSDGIPNYISDDDSYTNPNKRERRLQQNKTDFLLTLSNQDEIFMNLSKDEQRRYMRNRILIDFDFIPEDLQQRIIDEYESFLTDNDLSTIHKYLVQHKLKTFLINIGDFLDEI